LDLAAAIVYAVEADVRRAIYWLAAAVLTVVVTW
jgi:5-enolpyruvylshikimate-3-phosphate synthase